MNPAFPIAENYEKLAPVVERLYHHTDHIAQIALLPLFLLSVLMAYSEDLGLQGAVVSRLKRLIVTMLLLVAFPSLTGFIKNIGQEIALSIDNLEGIDQFLKQASEKAGDYGAGVKSLLDFGNDLVISLLVSVSYVILYVARYLLVAFYHFYWMILLVTGPLLILGNLFESTSNLTKNLFKSLLLVSSWPIVWSTLSAFLKALPFQDAYSIEGGYTAIVIMNLIIAVGLLFSPFMLAQFCEGAIVGMGSGLVSTGAKAATAFASPHAARLAAWTGEKVYPKVKDYVPGRDRIFKLYQHLAPKEPDKKFRGGRSFAFLLLLVPALAHAGSQTTINVRPGLSSVVCFEKTPDSIAIGDGRFFQAQKVGTNLLLRSTSPNQETNLLVFVGNALSASYALKSNLVLPHSESVNCDKKPEPKSAAKLVAKPKVLSSAAKGDLRAELLRKAWESPKRDYFTIRVQLVNRGTGTWRPDWSKVSLKQGTRQFSHSGLSSGRKEVPPGARVSFDVQFTRPELAANRGFLVIPSKEGVLELLVEKGGAQK
jgi:hypothetical protein